MPKPLRVIFLDVDGVLLTPSCYSDDDKPPRFKPAALTALRLIVERTGARIVVSSAWRQRSIKRTRALLESRGFELGPKIVGRTGEWRTEDGKWSRRDDEILEWLARPRRDPVESWVVLDDGTLELTGVEHRQVQTDPEEGLTNADAVLAIQYLRTPVPLPY